MNWQKGSVIAAICAAIVGAALAVWHWLKR